MLREVVLRQVGGPLCPYTQYIQSVVEVWGWWWVNDSELATTRVSEQGLLALSAREEKVAFGKPTARISDLW